MLLKKSESKYKNAATFKLNTSCDKNKCIKNINKNKTKLDHLFNAAFDYGYDNQLTSLRVSSCLSFFLPKNESTLKNVKRYRSISNNVLN